MKTYLDCIPCFFNQALRAARISNVDDEKIKLLFDELGMAIKNIPMHSTPPEIGVKIYQRIFEFTGIKDPYSDIKQENIRQAKSLIPRLKNIIKDSEDKLLTAIRIAIAGNVIDFGIDANFNIEDDLKKILKQDFAIFDYSDFKNILENAENILYIGDNCGESVFDSLLIKEMGKRTYYATREIPVINDVTIDDAIQSGLSEVCEVFSSGSYAPATILRQCNKKFMDLFNSADLIISKGQGNYEGLSEMTDKPIFFLLKAKCRVIARDIGVDLGGIILKGKV